MKTINVQPFNGYINIHTHNLIKETDETSVFNIDIRSAPQTPNTDNFYSAGLHPWYVQPDNNTYMQQVMAYTQKNNVLAIGETGIDRNCGVALELQESVFIHHIRIAEKVQKPVIIHCVRAFYEIMALYEKLQPGVPFIFHGYNNSIHIARELLAVNGFYLSFGAALQQAESNASLVLLQTPFEKFFLETDDRAVSISNVFAYAAHYKQCTVAELKEQIKINFKRVFSYE